MSNNKQSSVEWLVEQLGNYNEEMIFLYQSEIQEAKAMHKEESVDFALYAMMAESFNDLPEATKNQLREAIEVKYKEYYKL